MSNKCIAVRKVATPLRELTWHMGSHSVTCHPAEVTFPPLMMMMMCVLILIFVCRTLQMQKINNQEPPSETSGMD